MSSKGHVTIVWSTVCDTMHPTQTLGQVWKNKVSHSSATTSEPDAMYTQKVKAALIK